MPPLPYAEFAPSPALRPYVECYWVRGFSGGGTDTHRVLPDGCIDILFTFAGDAVPDVGSVVGAMTRPLLARTNGAASMMAARFRPGGARVFLGVPAAAFTDLRVPLREAWREVDPLRETLAALPTMTDRLRALDGALLRRLVVSPGPPRDLSAAVGIIISSGGRATVAQLSDAVGVTRQHLARRFAEYVGLPPKTLSRIVRARAVIERLNANGGATREVNWSMLALDAGYYDQSHFVAEFHELVGLTPERWLEAAANG